MKQLMFIALALLLAACEKPVLDNEDTASTKDANVILHFKQYEQTAFTRSATDITELCSRLNIAIFDADGTKVKTVAQKESDAGYGTVALTLASRLAPLRLRLCRRDRQHGPHPLRPTLRTTLCRT